MSYRPPVSRARRDAPVPAALMTVVAQHGRWGFWKCYDRLRLQGCRWNHKRVHGVYCVLRLNLPRRTKRRIPHRARRPLVAPPVLNQTWALDLMADALYDRRRFRALTIMDEGNREGLTIRVADNVAQVWADATRRDILKRLSQAEQTVSELARPYAISLAAIREAHWCARESRSRYEAPQWQGAGGLHCTGRDQDGRGAPGRVRAAVVSAL